MTIPFLNPAGLAATAPQWRGVAGKPGVFIHDDAPSVEVEVLLYRCGTCGRTQMTMHSLSAAHGIATPEERHEHSLCRVCRKPMSVIEGVS